MSEVQQIKSKMGTNSTSVLQWDLINSFDSFMNWVFILKVNASYRQMTGGAEIKLELYQFSVSLDLNNILTPRLNDDTLSILQVVVFIDCAEGLFFPSSIFFEDQYQKERVYLYYQQHSHMDYIPGIICGGFWYILLCTISSSNQLISSYCFGISSRYFGNIKLTIKEKVWKIGAKAKSIED